MSKPRPEAPAPARPRRSLRRGLLFAGLTLVLLLVGAELVLRIFLGNGGHRRILEPSPDPEVCLELKAGAETTYTGWLRRVPGTRMTVNEQRGRGAPLTPEDHPRVITLGDSFVYGQGVEEEEALPAALERALAVRGVAARVANHGVPGHSPARSVAFLEHRLLELEPDLVLLFVFSNDLDDDVLRCDVRPPPDSIQRTGERLHSALARSRLLRGIGLARQLRHGGGGPEESGPSERHRDPTERDGRRLAATVPPTDLQAPEVALVDAVDRLGRLGREHHFRSAVVLLTDESAFHRGRMCRGCRTAHALLGAAPMPVFDLGRSWEILRGDADAWFIPREGHLNPAGTELLVLPLARLLEEEPGLLGPSPD